MNNRTPAIKVPVAFVKTTAEYCKANGLTVAKYAVMVLRDYEPTLEVVLLADEFKAKHDLSEADYSMVVRMGKLGKYIYLGEVKYQYVKTVWHLCP